MSSTSDNQSQHKPRASDDYRLVVYRSDDFQEIRSFNLSATSIYVLVSAIILIICGLVFSLLAFTPLKKLIPGYGKIESNQQFLELVNGVDELSYTIEAQSVYLGALRTMLSSGLSSRDQGGLSGLVPEVSKNSNVPLTQPYPLPDTSPNLKKQNFSLQLSEKSELYDVLTQLKVYNPVSGLVSSEFDPNIKHYGVDILAPARTSVIAMMDGFVFSSGWDLETGYSIGIQHSNNILSFYKHNSQLLKEKGTFVRAGEAVAIIGNTGTLSNGPHLHFEIWHNGRPVNPQEILKFN